MLTDPSGRPYKPNEEQREALQAEFYRTNSVPKNSGADCGNNPESAPGSQPFPQAGLEDESWNDEDKNDDTRESQA